MTHEKYSHLKEFLKIEEPRNVLLMKGVFLAADWVKSLNSEVTVNLSISIKEYFVKENEVDQINILWVVSEAHRTEFIPLLKFLHSEINSFSDHVQDRLRSCLMTYELIPRPPFKIKNFHEDFQGIKLYPERYSIEIEGAETMLSQQEYALVTMLRVRTRQHNISLKAAEESLVNYILPGEQSIDINKILDDLFLRYPIYKGYINVSNGMIEWKIIANRGQSSILN